MADNETPRHPSVIVSDAGAPEGQVYVHDQKTGATVLAPRTEAGYTAAIRDLNGRK